MINSGIYFIQCKIGGHWRNLQFQSFKNRRLSTVTSRVRSVGLAHDIDLNARVLFKGLRKLQAGLVLSSWWWVFIREISVWLDTLGPSKHS